jgi:hypothetical protein
MKIGTAMAPCLQEIFRPQNCGALAETLPATGRAQDNRRLFRFYGEFCLHSDRSASDASRAGERKLARLDSEAIRRRDQGETLTDIARSYNVHPSTISRLTA